MRLLAVCLFSFSAKLADLFREFFSGTFFNLCVCLCVCTRAIARLCACARISLLASGLQLPQKQVAQKLLWSPHCYWENSATSEDKRVCSPSLLTPDATTQRSYSVQTDETGSRARKQNQASGLFMDLNYCRTLRVQPLQQLGTVLPLITHLTRVAGRIIDAVQPYQKAYIFIGIYICICTWTTHTHTQMSYSLPPCGISPSDVAWCPPLRMIGGFLHMSETERGEREKIPAESAFVARIIIFKCHSSLQQKWLQFQQLTAIATNHGSIKIHLKKKNKMVCCQFIYFT